MNKHVLLYIYNSFADPIVQGSVLTYVKRYKLINKGKAEFTLVTFEQKTYPLTDKEIEFHKQMLGSWDVDWIARKYHTGGKLILFKKIYDTLAGFILLIKLAVRKKIDLIYTVGTISGSMGFYLSKLIGAELLVHTFEPHSEFMVDFRIWSKKSLSYRLLNWMEGVLAKKATYLMTGTDAMIDRIKNVRNPIGVFKVPSCVDLEKFKPLAEARKRIRNDYNLTNSFVLLYVGKFGGIYFTKEPFEYFAEFLKFFKEKNPHILIISPNEKDWIESELKSAKIDQDYTILNNIPFTQIQDYINAGDIGYCGIPPLPSQKYRSPIKNGEYLACGLPYIVYEGVSEDDLTAIQDNVGVVLKNNSNFEIIRSLKTITVLFEQSRSELTNRCIDSAFRHRSIHHVDDFYMQVWGR